MSSVTKNPVWAELVQLVPIISFAFPFILTGEVDLGRAGPGFLVGAALFVAVSAGIALKQYVLNPILIGTGLWLLSGALAFNLPIAGLAGWMAEMRAFPLFAAILGVGIAAVLLSPRGAIGWRSTDRTWLRRASLVLLGASVVAVGWAWAFRQNVRLGGGLPFILLNVLRRALVLRHQRRAS